MILKNTNITVIIYYNIKINEKIISFTDVKSKLLSNY